MAKKRVSAEDVGLIDPVIEAISPGPPLPPEDPELKREACEAVPVLCEAPPVTEAIAEPPRRISGYELAARLKAERKAAKRQAQ